MTLSRVQSKAVSSAQLISSVITMDAPLTVGSEVVMLFAHADLTRIYSVTDDGGNTWTKVGEQVGNSNRRLQAFRASVTTPATNITLTASGNDSSTKFIHVHEFSGSTLQVVMASANDVDLNGSFSSGTISPTSNSGLVGLIYGATSSSPRYALTAGWTGSTVMSNTVGISGYKLEAAAGTFSFDTTSGAVQAASMIIGVYEGGAPPDTIAPTIDSAEVNIGGNQFNINASEVINGNVGFVVNASGGPVTLTYQSGEGTSSLIYTPSRLILSGEVITLNYTPGNIVDLASNALAAFTGLAVTNSSTQVADTTAPTPVSETIATSGNSIITTYSESVTGSTGITLQATGGVVTATYASGSGTDTLTWTLSRTIQTNESVSTAYTAGNIQDLSGNALANYTNRLAVNESTAGAGSTGSSGSVFKSTVLVLGSEDMRDYVKGETVEIDFNTILPTTLEAGTPTGLPAVVVVRQGTAIEITAGITLLIDHLGVGSHRAVIDTAQVNYVDAYDYIVKAKQGVIGSVDFSNQIIARFSLGRQALSSLMGADSYGGVKPTVAGRQIALDASGRPGTDWSNVGNPASVQNLTGTTTKAVTDGVNLATDAINANALAATGVTEMQAGLATSAEVAAIGTQLTNAEAALQAAIAITSTQVSQDLIAAALNTALSEIRKIPRGALEVLGGAVATRRNTSETPPQVITETID